MPPEFDDPARDFADTYPIGAWPRRKLRSELADELFEAITMRNCPWYRGVGVCGYGCHEEPACQTNAPVGGWSTRGPDPRRHLAIVPESSRVGCGDGCLSIQPA